MSLPASIPVFLLLLVDVVIALTVSPKSEQIIAHIGQAGREQTDCNGRHIVTVAVDLFLNRKKHKERRQTIKWGKVKVTQPKW